jgi:nitrous oxidase accessory protein
MAARRATEVSAVAPALVQPAGTSTAAAVSGGERRGDAAATLTIVAAAICALAAAWLLPWWTMKARAPQYGQRVLVVEVGPRDVEGDVREIDLLGHYVGIRPMGTLARVERTLAPVGMLGAAAGLLLAPWLRRRRLRALVVLPALVMPVLVMTDLKLWMSSAVNRRSADAPLELTVTRIDPKLVGEYAVGQFKVAAEFDTGFYAASLAGLLGLGLIFAVPLRRRPSGVAAALGVAVALLAAPRGATAKEIVVGPPGSATLASVLALAAPGDTVLVPAGTYRERVTIDRPLRLVGRPDAVIDGGGEGTVVRVTASGVELRGLTIRGSGESYTAEDAAVRIEHAADVRLVDLRLEDALFGVFAVQADRCAIEGSTVIGKDLPVVRRGDGIRLWYSSGCRLAGNHVERSRDVVIWYSSRTVVEDNVVRTSRYGLHYMYSDDNVFRRNRFEDDQVGAAIMYSRRVELTGNAFSFANGPAAYGLLVKDADDVFIVGNRFVRNATGLFFDGAPQARGGRVDVHRNLVARNQVGIALEPHSRGIRLWENAFVGNRNQVQLVGTGTAEGNAWAVDGRGNHWSDAVVYDRDGDGVSELPYRAESTYEVLADRHPTLAFFDGTAAAEALDLAARLFPIFAPRPKFTDPHPLLHPTLTAWTRSDGGTGRGLGLAAAGAALLGATALGWWALRRTLA